MSGWLFVASHGWGVKSHGLALASSRTAGSTDRHFVPYIPSPRGRSVLRGPLRLHAEPSIAAMQGFPVAVPFGDELLQRLRGRVRAQHFKILERKGAFDALRDVC